MATRHATTPPPPSRIRTPPTPKHGAGYYSYEPFSPRRSQRVSQLRQNLAVPTPALVPQSRKSPLRRATSTSSSQTLSPPSSPVDKPLSLQDTPARPTPARQSLFTRNRPDNFSCALDAPQQSHLPTPSSMLPTPNKTPRKRDLPALQSTARILNFKPASTNQVMPTPRRRAKSRLTLDEDDDGAQNNISVFTDVQDRVPDLDDTEDNPFVGPRKTRGRGRAKTAPAASREEQTVDQDSNDKGIYYVFRGKKIFRRFESSNEQTDSDASAASYDSLKRKAGSSAARPLTRSSFKPRLLWPSTNSDNDADEEALTDIEEDNIPTSASAPFNSFTQPTITPAKKPSAMPATPPSSHRQPRSAYHMDPTPQLSGTSDGGSLASPSTTPMPQKGKQGGASFAKWLRTKGADASDTRGEKRSHVSISEPELPNKRNRSNLFNVHRP